MSYRDELTAAQAQIERLTEALDDARRENAELRAMTESEPAAAIVRPERPAVGLVGPLHYDPPETYFPLVSCLRYVVPLAFRNPPKRDALDSNNLLAVIWHWGFAWPFVTLLWKPIFLASLVLALPWFALLTAAASLLLLPLIPLTRLRVGPREPSTGTGWPQHADQDSAGTFFFFLLLATPVLLPVFVAFWIALISGETLDEG
jgi:hypothetical protein